ncbi:hypothetical protein BT69DRAFT_360981 [Atractiella rhizophila]|nr:hypothetical protein BT69DRAFT_360981 [Atractiella rhizophila]
MEECDHTTMGGRKGLGCLPPATIPPRVGIKDVPHEILHLIFTYATYASTTAEADQKNRGGKFEMKSYPILQTLSLVCRDFTSPAQRLLLQNVNIASKSQVKDFVALCKKMKAAPLSSSAASGPHLGVGKPRAMGNQDLVKNLTFRCFGSGKASTTRSTAQAVFQQLKNLRCLIVDAGNSSQATFDLIGFLDVLKRDGPKQAYELRIRLPTLYLWSDTSLKDQVNTALSEMTFVTSLVCENWPKGFACFRTDASINLTSVTFNKCDTALDTLESISRIRPISPRLREINLSMSRSQYSNPSRPFVATFQSLDLSNLQTFRFCLGQSSVWATSSNPDLAPLADVLNLFAVVSKIRVLELNGPYITREATEKAPCEAITNLLSAIPERIVAFGMGSNEAFKNPGHQAPSYNSMLAMSSKSKTPARISTPPRPPQPRPQASLASPPRETRQEAFRNTFLRLNLPNLKELDVKIRTYDFDEKDYRPLEEVCSDRNIHLNTLESLFLPEK